MKKFAMLVLFLLLSFNSSWAAEQAELSKLFSVHGRFDFQPSHGNRYLIVSNLGKIKPYVIDLTNSNQVVYVGKHNCIEIKISNDEKYLVEYQSSADCNAIEEVHPLYAEFQIVDLGKKQVLFSHLGWRVQFSYDSKSLIYQKFGQELSLTNYLEIDSGAEKTGLCAHQALSHYTGDEYAKISRNGKYIYCLSFRHGIAYEVKELATGQAMDVIYGPASVDNMRKEFSEDNSYYFRNDMGVYLAPAAYDLNSGGIWIEFPNTEGARLWDVRFSQDGQYMLLTDSINVPIGSDSKPVFYLNLINMQSKQSHRIPIAGFSSLPAVDSAKNMFYALAPDSSYRAYDLDGKELWRAQSNEFTSLGIFRNLRTSVDGSLVIVETTKTIDLDIYTSVYRVTPP